MPGAEGWQRRPQARADSLLFAEPPRPLLRVFLRRKGLILLRPLKRARGRSRGERLADDFGYLLTPKVPISFNHLPDSNDKSRGNDLSTLKAISFASHLTCQRLLYKEKKYAEYRQNIFQYCRIIYRCDKNQS